jgi:hypothetical protein
MKTEIEIWNGRGWNNYAGIRTLKFLQVGTRGLASNQGIAKIEVCPRDSERPYGIAAFYFDADGELIFTQGFDQNDSAEFIRERIFALLVKGVRNQIDERGKEIARAAFVEKIKAWKNNWPKINTPPAQSGANKLRWKIGQWREQTGKFSRKTCWKFTTAICTGKMTFAAVKEKFFAK